MKYIVRMEFGSLVYGTSLPSSDLDFKAIYVPHGRDILLGRAKDSIIQNTKSDPNAKNSPDDIDMEIFSVQRYLNLLMQGQTVALDMLFMPEKHILEYNHVWRNIQFYKRSFITSGVNAFVGYARQQAAKYGIKGSRIAAVREVLEVLNALPGSERLRERREQLISWVDARNNEFIKMVDCRGPGGIYEPHLEVCNRKIPLHSSVKYATEIYQKIFDEYGARARLAETNQGVDWKALMHAVRVNNEAHELLQTTNITFPRPEAARLLKIRKGELSYSEVAEEIETGLIKLEELSKTSTLRKEPDRVMADRLVECAYLDSVMEARREGL